MTHLVASIMPGSVEDAQRGASRAWSAGATAVELRIDAFRGDPAQLNRFLRSEPNHAWIVTCRSFAEGGMDRRAPAERLALLRAVAGGRDVWVDLEARDFDGPAVSQFKRVILSYHDVAQRPQDLERFVEDAIQRRPDVVAKAAYHCHDITDSFPALDLMHRRGGRVLAVAMGEAGAWTRVLARKLGALGTFAFVEGSAPTAPGQLSITALKHQYRWDSLGPDTSVYGVIGDPVAHSMSPFLMNRWFEQTSQNAVYLPLLVSREGDAFARFLNECKSRPWLDARGFSVTLPHKGAALKWAGPGADRTARQIGAANTLVLDGGHVRAYNTDAHAAMDSLVHALGIDRSELSGFTVDVLGTGGAARAVLAGLRDFGAAVTVFGRNIERLRELATTFGCDAKTWEDRFRRRGKVLVNCTSIGMWPHSDDSPIGPDDLSGCPLVFDLIYNPPRTRLLRHAEAAGCHTLNGLDMFIRQAATQFELWTGASPDQEAAREWLTMVLEQSCACPSSEQQRGDSIPPVSGERIPCTQSESARAQGGGSSQNSGAVDPNGGPVEKLPHRRIALIGLRGSGKTVVGQALARLLETKLADTDAWIVEQAGRTIADIFAAAGEAAFRAWERRIVEEACATDAGVISLGGGAVLDDQLARRIQEIATIVWLTAPPDLLAERIARDPATQSSRPSLTGLPLREELAQQLKQRQPRYQALADLTIDASTGSPEEIAEHILTRLALRHS